MTKHMLEKMVQGDHATSLAYSITVIYIHCTTVFIWKIFLLSVVCPPMKEKVSKLIHHGLPFLDNSTQSEYQGTH